LLVFLVKDAMKSVKWKLIQAIDYRMIARKERLEKRPLFFYAFF